MGSTPSVKALNLTSQLAIPPGQESYSQWELCTSNCIDKQLVPGKTRILGAAIHMHRMATSGEVFIEHPDGSRTSVIRSDHYDFNHIQVPY